VSEIDFTYIMRPSELFKQYLGEMMHETQFQYGMLGMALEIVTVIKTLESLPTASVGTRQETISVLHTLLQDLHLDEYAYEWYDRLNDWRRPKFLPEPASVALSPGLERIVGADVPPLPELPALASQLASDLGLGQEPEHTDAQPGIDQTTDQPSFSTDEGPSEGEPTTRGE